MTFEQWLAANPAIKLNWDQSDAGSVEEQQILAQYAAANPTAAAPAATAPVTLADLLAPSSTNAPSAVAPTAQGIGGTKVDDSGYATGPTFDQFLAQNPTIKNTWDNAEPGGAAEANVIAQFNAAGGTGSTVETPTQYGTPGNYTGFWGDALNGIQAGTRPDYTPKTANIPDYESWLAAQPEESGDTPTNWMEKYVNTFYNAPNYSDPGGLSGFLEDAPVYMALAGLGVGGAEALGLLGGEAAAGGTIAGSEGTGALVGGAAGDTLAGTTAAELGGAGAFDAGGVGALGSADATAAGLGGITAPATGGTLASLLDTPAGDAAIDPTATVGSTGGNAANLPTGDYYGLPGTTAATGTAATGSWTIPGTDITIPNQVLTGGLQAILGYLGSSAQGDAYKDVAAQNLAIGAPYRSRLEQSYQPGFDLMSQPGYGDAFNRAADISARSWSARGGNPAGNPTLQAGILNDIWSGSYLPALSNYRGGLGQFGGLGLNTSGAASMAGAEQTGGAYNALGYGLGTATKQPSSLEAMLAELTKGYKNTVGGNQVGG